MEKKLAKKLLGARMNLSQSMGKKLSQREFGEMCGWGNAQSRVSNYESGRRTPPLHDLLKIIHVSGSNPKDFFEDGLANIDMDHVSLAFDKVGNESSLPSGFSRFELLPLSNSIEPYVIHDEVPMMRKSKAKKIAGVYADRSEKDIKEGDEIYFDVHLITVSRRGLWMFQIGDEGVFANVSLNSDGTITDATLGDLSKTKCLGKVICVTKNY